MPTKISHRVPLSQLHFENTGVTVPWKKVRFFIPYESMHLEAAPGCMLELMTGHFKADLTMLLRMAPKTGDIQEVSIEPHSEALIELTQAVQCLKEFRGEIEKLVAERSLTLQKARDILAGMNYRIESDECLNQLLVQSVAACSPQRSTDEFRLPLARLEFRQSGVSFSYLRQRYPLPTDRLTGLIPRPGFNQLRRQMAGEAVFTRCHETLYRWDLESASLVAGRTEEKVTTGYLRIADSQAFKQQCCREIIHAFNAYKTRSLKRLARLLAHWGIAPDDPEAGRMIVSGLRPQGETGRIQPILLKEVRFGSKNITIPLEGRDQVIPPTKFTFKTDRIFNQVKDDLKVFTHQILVRYDSTREFHWHAQEPHYRLGRTKVIVQGVDIDRYVKGQLSRIYQLYVIKKKRLPSLRPKPKPGVKRVARIPAKQASAYIQILEGIAAEIFFAGGGYWFHVKKFRAKTDRLVWEVKTEKLATFIFDWPGKRNLALLVQTIIDLSRRDIPSAATIGYIARVVHPHNDIQTWKQNVWQTL